MAKRKRLSLVPPAASHAEGTSELKVDNDRASTRSRTPISDIAGDAAKQSALEMVSDEMRLAREEGRVIVKLPLDAVQDDYLVRDRLTVDSEDMLSLQQSLEERGQQAPIEVVDLGAGQYGLISGWRRMRALRMIYDQKNDPIFGQVQAVIRSPADAADAYRAMVEENEIRANLSFYERAHIAVKAVEEGAYLDTKAAVRGLFSAARSSKQSKILAFTRLVTALGPDLRWPAAISEKLGLAIAAAAKDEPKTFVLLTQALRSAQAESSVVERQVIEQVLRGKSTTSTPKPISQGVAMKSSQGRIILEGAGVNATFVAELKAWLAARQV